MYTHLAVLLGDESFKLKNKTKLLYLLFITLGSHCAISQERSPIFDWVVDPTPSNLCGGYYAYSPAHLQFSVDELRTLPLTLSADQTDFALEGTSSLLTGNVTLTQGSRHLRADKILIQRSSITQAWDELWATGNIEFYTPGALVWGSEAVYYHTKQFFSLKDAHYRWYAKQARGHARQIDVNEAGILHLTAAEYTTCAPLSDTWLLKANTITLYPQKGRATATHIRLNWFDIPIVYLPYINYPIDNQRHSGFLFPTYGSTSNSGYALGIPYYWNIAPNYDMTLVANWLSERGSEFQTKVRYLFSLGDGSFRWHILPHDRKYEAFSQDNRISPPGGLSPSDPRILALDTPTTRYVFHYEHATHFDERWQFNILFEYVSDDNYFVDLGNDIHTASTIHLPQKANVTYYGEHWTHYFNVEEYQVLEPLSKPINDAIYRRQPQWLFHALYPEQWWNFTFELTGETVNFAHQPDIMTQAAVTVGQRYHLRPSLSMPLADSWFFFTPRYQLDWLSYSLSLGEAAAPLELPSRPTRTIPLYDLDMGLIYERDWRYHETRFSQTLEPRLYYLYVPYRNQNLYPNFDSGIINFSYNQLFRDNRFSGHDRVGDANQLTLSLTSRFLPTSSGQEWLRASLGQIFYFSTPRVFLCEEENASSICIVSEDPVQLAGQSATSSNLIGQLDFHPHPRWSGSIFGEWDPEHWQTEQAAINVQYHPSLQKIINFNYYWQLEDFAQFDPTTLTMGSLNQAEMSVFWPLTARWQWLARWHYDLVQHQTIELLGGLEYNGCCMAFQLVGSRYMQSGNFFYPDPFASGVFMQVVFKGLSSFPLNNPDGRLREKIPGYTPLHSRHQRLTTTSREISPYWE